MPLMVKSAERALRILEFFSFVRRAATASEVQEALELPQSSASVLLHSLVDLGYLEYVPAGRMYRPTLRVTVLGDWLKPALSSNLKSERLDELRQKIRETVAVGRRLGSQVQYIRILLSNEEIQFYMQEGLRRPLSTNASGRALLSAMEDPAIRKIVRRNNAEAKSKELYVDENAVLTAIRKIRRTGIAETDFSLGGRQDHHALAMLVPTEITNEQLCIGVVGPRSRILRHRTKIIETLREWLIA